MKTMRFPRKPKFALLGHGKHLCDFVDLLMARKLPKPIIVTHPEEQHQRDRKLLDESIYRNLFRLSDKYNIYVIETSNPSEELVKTIISRNKCNVAFSFSCRSIIKRDFIELFKGRIVNIHPSVLPLERGGGTHSYRIMNNQRTVGATIHLVEDGIDSGDILLSWYDTIRRKNPLPIHYERKTQEIYEMLTIRFLDRLEDGREFELIQQNEKDSTYLPRLYTELNGAINWGWRDQEILRFINAFERPYPNAFTYINNRKVRLSGAELECCNCRNHPFLIGKVINVSNDGYAVKVLLRKHFLLCNTSIRCKVGQTMYTPQDVLQTARTQVANVRDMA